MVMERTKLAALALTFLSLMTALEMPVIVSLFTKPVTANVAGAMVLEPLYVAVTLIPSGAGVILPVIPVGCTRV